MSGELYVLRVQWDDSEKMVDQVVTKWKLPQLYKS